MTYTNDFPLFQNRPELIYLDNAATSQKPQVVLDAISSYYTTSNSNIHRGPHFMAEEATKLYNSSRSTVSKFINAKHSHEIIFTRNATESINLIAKTFGTQLQSGDVVCISRLEHHSNIVPWLQLKEDIGIDVIFFDLPSDSINIPNNCKLLSITGMSNVTGYLPNLKALIKQAHDIGVPVLLDACQLAVHSPIDVQDLDVDFLAFSGHKLYGPTGIGVLYAKEEILNSIPPFLGGGDMIQEVNEDSFKPAGLPDKFEAGTPNIAGAVGLMAAIKYVESIGWDIIQSTEKELTSYALTKLRELDYIQIIGHESDTNYGSVISFTMDTVHPHDVAEGLSSKGICMRAGHHCCQIFMDHNNLSATVRMSLAIFNTKEEIDKTINTLKEIYIYFN